MSILLEQIIQPDTLDKFKIYEKLIVQWNQSISLVQQNTIGQFQSRHILDSLQIIPIILYHRENRFSEYGNTSLKEQFDEIARSDKKLEFIVQESKDVSILDIGSGGGFPGLPLAIVGFKNITLVESNRKKALFLQEAARSVQAEVKVLVERAANLSNKFQIFISRATLDLNGLCSILSELMMPKGIGIFHKGKTWNDELNKALEKWKFDYEIINSITSHDGVIIIIQNLKKS